MGYGKSIEDIRRHTATAQGTASLIDLGSPFGGDPSVQYQFQADGIPYTGSGPGGQLGNRGLDKLQPGDAVTVRYSSLHPWHSCTCEPDIWDWESETMRQDWEFRATGLLYFFPVAAIVVLAIGGSWSGMLTRLVKAR